MAGQREAANGDIAAKKQHGQGGSKSRSGIDTKQGGVGQWIAHKRLHHQSGGGQTETCQQGGAERRQAKVVDDEIGGGLFAMACQGIPHVAKREVLAAGEHHNGRQDNEQDEGKAEERFFHKFN